MMRKNIIGFGAGVLSVVALSGNANVEGLKLNVWRFGRSKTGPSAGERVPLMREMRRAARVQRNNGSSRRSARQRSGRFARVADQPEYAPSALIQAPVLAESTPLTAEPAITTLDCSLFQHEDPHSVAMCLDGINPLDQSARRRWMRTQTDYMLDKEAEQSGQAMPAGDADVSDSLQRIKDIMDVDDDVARAILEEQQILEGHLAAVAALGRKHRAYAAVAAPGSNSATSSSAATGKATPMSLGASERDDLSV